VVFADAKNLEANLVNQDNLIQQIVQALESAQQSVQLPGWK
jgi:hypothetical protein